MKPSVYLTKTIPLLIREYWAQKKMAAGSAAIFIIYNFCTYHFRQA